MKIRDRQNWNKRSSDLERTEERNGKQRQFRNFVYIRKVGGTVGPLAPVETASADGLKCVKIEGGDFPGTEGRGTLPFLH